MLKTRKGKGVNIEKRHHAWKTRKWKKYTQQTTIDKHEGMEGIVKIWAPTNRMPNRQNNLHSHN